MVNPLISFSEDIALFRSSSGGGMWVGDALRGARTHVERTLGYTKPAAQGSKKGLLVSISWMMGDLHQLRYSAWKRQ